MPLRIKVDEDLPTELTGLLRDAGHDAMSVNDQRLTGSSDQTIWDIIQAENRLLITADKGFVHAQLHAPGTHAGVVLLRLPQESRGAYLALTKKLLGEFDLQIASSAIVVATPHTIRIYRGD